MTREQKSMVRETISAMQAVLTAADDAVSNPLDDVVAAVGADEWFLVQVDELESILMKMLQRLRDLSAMSPQELQTLALRSSV